LPGILTGKKMIIRNLIADNFSNFAPNFDDGGFVVNLVEGVVKKLFRT
jgi:hypothetical protein